jgi:hypothetical protein
MSLDVAELILEIEGRFGVTIPNRAAEGIRTVGDLHRYLLRWRDQALAGVCVSGATFYQARRALCDLFGLHRRDVCPTSALEGLVPARDRRRHWQRLRQAMSPFDLPNLQRPRWLRAALAFGGGGLLLAGVPASWRVGALSLLPLWATGCALLLLLTVALTRPLALCVPGGCGTMRGLVRHVLGGDRDLAHAALRHLSAREIWDQLCLLLGEQLGVDAALLRPETDFAEIIGP